MDRKKLYVPPRSTPYDLEHLPSWLQLIRDALVIHAPHHVTPVYTTVVDEDEDRRYIDVSEKFCELVGYGPEDLIGTRYDLLTAPETADIETTYNLFLRSGYMHGLWVLVHRTGYPILIRYESWLRWDANIQSNIELVQSFT